MTEYGIKAAREYLVDGHPLTSLEAQILFGVADLNKIISDLRSEHYFILRGRITFAAAIVRMRGQAELIPPRNLPVRELELTEYRISI